MSLDEVADKVVRIPRDYWDRRNVGPYQLLRESGYFELVSASAAYIKLEIEDIRRD